MDHFLCGLGGGIPDTFMCTWKLTYYKDDREVPDNWLATYTFEKQNCTLTFEGCMNSCRQQAPEYIGREGRLVFNGIGQDAVTFSVWDDKPAYPFQGNVIEPVERFDPAKAPQWPTHMQDFLHCVRTGERPKCNVDEAFIEVVTLLMSVESYKLKREVRWDAAAEKIV